jgi:hypothetical protein
VGPHTHTHTHARTSGRAQVRGEGRSAFGGGAQKGLGLGPVECVVGELDGGWRGRGGAVAVE